VSQIPIVFVIFVYFPSFHIFPPLLKKMIIDLLLLLLALFNAVNTPLGKEEPDKDNDDLFDRMNYAETGKSWTVEARSNGASSEVVINLLQSETNPEKGLGAIFHVDGRFPTPNVDYFGKVTDFEFPIAGPSMLKGKSALVQSAFCPKSDRVCNDGSSWTVRQTEMEEETYTYKPVVDSPILLETLVVFKNPGQCEYFIAEWTDICDSSALLDRISAYLRETDLINMIRKFNAGYGSGGSKSEIHADAVVLLNNFQGLKDMALMEQIGEILPDAKNLYKLIEGLERMEREYRPIIW
jgi:hypothetical protein